MTWSPENRRATLRAGVPPCQATLDSSNCTQAPTHTPPEPRGTARHSTQRARHRADRPKATGRRAQARTPHHGAGTAARGPHGEHGHAAKRTEGALQPTGVYIRSAEVKLEGKPKGTAMYKIMGCACNAATRAEQGMLYRMSKNFLSGRTNCQNLSPPEDTPDHEGATHHQSVPCRPNATTTTGTDPARPLRLNTSDSSTGRPLGGEDDGQRI